MAGIPCELTLGHHPAETTPAAPFPLPCHDPAASGWRKVGNAIRVGAVTRAPGWDRYSDGRLTFKFTRLSELAQPLPSEGLHITWELPANLQIQDFFAASVFSAFSDNHRQCPVCSVAGLPMMA
eukprot:366217-Chlamydomonas_euryale.AAC.25